MKTTNTDNLKDFFNKAATRKYDEIICEVPRDRIFEILDKEWGAKILEDDEDGENRQYRRGNIFFNVDYSHTDGCVTLGYLKERQEETT